MTSDDNIDLTKPFPQETGASRKHLVSQMNGQPMLNNEYATLLYLKRSPGFIADAKPMTIVDAPDAPFNVAGGEKGFLRNSGYEQTSPENCTQVGFMAMAPRMGIDFARGWHINLSPRSADDVIKYAKAHFSGCMEQLAGDGEILGKEGLQLCASLYRQPEGLNELHKSRHGFSHPHISQSFIPLYNQLAPLFSNALKAWNETGAPNARQLFDFEMDALKIAKPFLFPSSPSDTSKSQGR